MKFDRESRVATTIQNLEHGVVYTINDIADTCGKGLALRRGFSTKEVALYLRYRDDMQLVSRGKWMRKPVEASV